MRKTVVSCAQKFEKIKSCLNKGPPNHLPIIGAIAEDVSGLVSLKQFHVDFNELSGPLPINLLTMVQSLESYRMKGNQFYLPEPSDEDVIKLEGLRELVLADCGLR